MAGKTKHMARSHRSYSNNESVFNRFRYDAKSVADGKKYRDLTKKSFFQKAIDGVRSVFKKDKGGEK